MERSKIPQIQVQSCPCSAPWNPKRKCKRKNLLRFFKEFRELKIIETYIEPPSKVGKKHFEEKLSKPAEYKLSVKVIKPEVGTLERITGMKHIVENFTIVKPRCERVHFNQKVANPNTKTNPNMEKYRKTRNDSVTKAASNEKPNGETASKGIKWKEKVKMDALNDEKKAVSELIQWFFLFSWSNYNTKK